MKKIICLILLASSFLFGSNVYFLNDGPGYIYRDGDTWTSGSEGRATVNYHVWADPAKYTYNSAGARFKDPDGIWSSWSYTSDGLGLRYLFKEGDWEVEGRVWVTADIYGYGNYWMYTNGTLDFDVEDTTPPPVPERIGSTTYNNHPKISWNSGGTAYDRSGYSVYKKDGGSTYDFLATISNTYYVDNNEIIYTPGNDKIYVYYKVKANDINGNSSALSDDVRVACNEPLSKKSETGYFQSTDIVDFRMNSNYPNPFNPSTTITFQFPESGYATLKIYNSLGQEVAVLLDGYVESGAYAILFNAKDLPSGMYFATLQINNFSQTKKMILQK